MSSTGSTGPRLRGHASISVLIRSQLLHKRLFPEQPLLLASIMLSETHQETPCTDQVSPTTTSPSSKTSRYGRRRSSSSAQRHPTCSIIPVQPTQTLRTVMAIHLSTRHPRQAPQSAPAMPERSSMYRRFPASSAERVRFNWRPKSSSNPVFASEPPEAIPAASIASTLPAVSQHPFLLFR